MNKLPRFHSTVAGTPAVSEGELDRSGVGSMRRRVVPPTSFGGHMPNDVLNAEQFDMEEAYTGELLVTLLLHLQLSRTRFDIDAEYSRMLTLFGHMFGYRG